LVRRETEEHFRYLADTVPVMIWTSGVDGGSSYNNKRWMEFTGQSREQTLGKGWADAIHPEDRQRAVETNKRAFDRREPYQREYRLRRHDGEYRWVLGSGVPRFNPDGSFAGYIGSVIDVTELKHASEARQRSEERFRMAAQAGRMFAYEWDAATDVIVRSEGVAQVLGADEGVRTTGQQILTMVPPEDRERLIAAVAQLSPAEPYLRISYRMVRSDGTVIWVERNSRAHFDEQGKMLRLVGMVMDITQRKLAEEALKGMTRKLIEAQEQERSRIARELHDDINQRLALLSVEIQQVREVSPITYGELRSRMDELGKRTSEISAVVQSLSHELHSSRLEYLGLVSAMKGFCKEFGDKHKVEIDFSNEGIPSGIPPEISLCLFRIMQEGLQNALKHSGVKFFEVELHGSPAEIRLTVRDSGVGYEPELAKDTPGLGLMSMRERVRLVKGTISITSKPQSGTEINVRVPLQAGAQREQGKLAGA
jgi:PAS domain S-box-containing protein